MHRTTIIQAIDPASVDARAEQVMVTMRDGTRLATDVYLPDRVPAATVLVRLPYDKCGRYTFMPALAPLVLERSYAFVVQDVRGKFRSEGETMPYLHEVPDGYDTIEWVTAQTWSNGRVGVFGDSYYGWTQWAAVASGHPALRAIVPRVSGTGLASMRMATRWDRGIVPLYGAQYFAEHWTDRRAYELDIDWGIRPLSALFDEPFRQIGRRSAAFDRMVTPGVDIVPFPLGHPFTHREVPALHSVGWWDNILPFSMDDYMTLQSRGRTLQHLIADSTDHENYPLERVPIQPADDHDTNDEALARILPRYIGPGLDFFDAFLREDGDAEVPRVRWHVGHGNWHESDFWPPPGSKSHRLYLDAPDRATADAEGGRLVEKRPGSAGRAAGDHDPDHLVPSTVTNPFAFVREYPDEQRVQARDDVATFTGEPVTDDVELAGPVEARVRFTSTARSAQLYLKLCDVAPDGSARMIVRGEAFAPQAQLERPVSVYMSHTAYRLRAGHRLRLQLASSDFPLFLPLLGDGRDPWQSLTTEASRVSVGSGGGHPSYLSVHLVEHPP
jgi:uncharacterized protein